MKRRTTQIAAIWLALILLFSSCTQNIPDEPSVSASITDITTAAREETSGIAETESDTESVETEPDETTAAEDTSPPPPALDEMSPEELLSYAISLRADYLSYILTTDIRSELDVGDETELSRSASVLSVAYPNASYSATADGVTSELLLSGGELYTAGVRGKYRVGGYDIASFCEYIGDLFPLTAFTDGRAEPAAEGISLAFSSIGEDGKKILRSLLALPDGYAVIPICTELTARISPAGDLTESHVHLELEVRNEDDALLMDLLIEATGRTDNIGGEVSLPVPVPEDHTSFPDLDSVRRYEALMDDLDGFKANRSGFEFIHTDNSSVISANKSITPTSRTVYAYDKYVGASIDKAYDVGDGTGGRTSLTHFNFLHSFSMLDGGNIFVDSTLDASNLFFTLFYPLDTALFSLGSYTALDTNASGAQGLYFEIDGATAQRIAGRLLLSAGVYSSSALSDVKARAYILTDQYGQVASVGYSFSATATVKGEEYRLTREVRVDITSRTKGNVKVIYIDVEE